MKTIAVTGGIGSGKSNFCALLKARGYAVLDADILSKEVLFQSEISAKISEVFGPLAFLSAGILNREYVGKLVFGNPSLRKELEDITHPAIAALMEQKRDFLASQFAESWLFYEASLIYESGREKDFDAVIVVTADQEIRLSRLVNFRKLSREKAENVLLAQLPDDEKTKKADFVVDNSFSREDLKNAALSTIEKLVEKFALQKL